MIKLRLALVYFAMTAIGAVAQERGAANAAPVFSYEQQYEAARAMAATGATQAAVRAYTQLLARSPGNVDVLLGRGQVYARMGMWAESEADLLAATSATPDYADLWSALGDMYAWSGRAWLAIDAYTRLIALRGGDPAAYLARARAYRASLQLPAARSDVAAAARLGADAQTIDALLGSLLSSANNPDRLVPEGYHWSASIGSALTTFNWPQSNWSDNTLSLRRHFMRGSIAVEALRARRFDRQDQAWALDGYVDVWGGAYANLRYQHAADARLFPVHAWRAELVQAVGSGWEVSGSADSLGFSGAHTRLYGLAVGKYVGNFYAQGRHLAVSDDGIAHRGSDRLLLRYFYAGDADNYVELNAGAANADMQISKAGARERLSSAGLALKQFPGARWGYKIEASVARTSSSYAQRSVSATLVRRW